MTELITRCPRCGEPTAVHLGGEPGERVYDCMACDAELHETESGMTVCPEAVDGAVEVVIPAPVEQQPVAESEAVRRDPDAGAVPSA